jgi:hypothetical protein
MSRTIVAFTGKRGHGKTTAAQALMEKGYEHICFADPLRQIVHIAYGVTFEEMSDPVLKEKPLDRWPFKSPRELLQVVGTDMFRAYLDDTWTKAFERRSAEFDKVVCSDLRFPNEEECLRDLDGKVVRVTDPKKNLTDVASQHASETAIDQIVADVEIINDGTIFDLQDKALVVAGF